MTYPISYQIAGDVQVTATKEGSEFRFHLTYADGKVVTFGYTEEATNKIAMNHPITDRNQYHAMVALWEMQLTA